MKQITPTKLDLNKAMKAFKEYLTKSKTNTGKIKFEYDLSKVTSDIKPKVVFTTEAYGKITTLVDSASKEIAWHGLVSKEDDVYVVEDIVVYPQVVTATTVESDDEDYATWLMNFNDESFNKLKLHGHSHVNMSVSPSSTDLTFYNKMLNIMDKDAFYIFMIMNKKKDLTIWIYDFPNNIIFENKDISVITPFGDWYKSIVKDFIKENISKYKSFDDFGKDWRDYDEFK